MLNVAFTVVQVNLVLGINTTVGMSTDFDFRRNNADVASIRISVPNGVTGKFTNSGNVAVASQDSIDMAINSQGGGTIDNYIYTVECEQQ